MPEKKKKKRLLCDAFQVARQRVSGEKLRPTERDKKQVRWDAERK